MNLSDLGTTALNDSVDMEHLPEQMGSFAPPPPPGPYIWELSPLSGANFDKVDSEAHGARVKVKFDANAPLVIRQSPGGLHDGEPFQTTITNVPRARGKAEDAPKVSDWDYLNAALGHKTRPASNRAFADQLLADAQRRAQFGADIEWSWNCSAERDAYFDDGQGGSQPAPDPNSAGQNLKGCGCRYYQGTTDKAATPPDSATKGKAGTVGKRNVAGEGEPPRLEYPLRIECGCGAIVRGFANLTRFRQVNK